MRNVEDKPWIYAQVLHSNHETGQSAYRLLLQIEWRMAEQFDFQHVFRPMDSLTDSARAGQALREAADADLIVLALHDDALAPGVKRWLERLPPANSERRRALVLLDAPSHAADEEAVKRRAWLVGLADRKRMAFFSHHALGTSLGSAPLKTPIWENILANWAGVTRDARQTLTFLNRTWKRRPQEASCSGPE